MRIIIESWLTSRCGAQCHSAEYYIGSTIILEILPFKLGMTDGVIRGRGNVAIVSHHGRQLGVVDVVEVGLLGVAPLCEQELAILVGGGAIGQISLHFSDPVYKGICAPIPGEDFPVENPGKNGLFIDFLYKEVIILSNVEQVYQNRLAVLIFDIVSITVIISRKREALIFVHVSEMSSDAGRPCTEAFSA